MPRTNAIVRFNTHSKNTDELGLCGVVFLVPEPVYPGLMRVIEVGR